MAWSRVADVAHTVTAGEEITVKVLRVDAETQKIALGVKQLTEDPWSKVQESYEAGQVRAGRITRIAEFGAFVELEPGVEGLAHASTFPPAAGRDSWSRSIAVGMTGDFEILEIDPAKRRIGVALVSTAARGDDVAAVPGSAAKGAIVPGARLTGTIERVEKFGVFVFLAPGRTGLVPLSETGVAREGDVARAFQAGATIEVMVLEVDPSGRRIRLSRKAILDAQEADELREYRERSSPPQADSLGSLGDKLRSALKPHKE
jgi:small subunit ribosomal protein S1